MKKIYLLFILPLLLLLAERGNAQTDTIAYWSFKNSFTMVSALNSGYVDADSMGSGTLIGIQYEIPGGFQRATLGNGNPGALGVSNLRGNDTLGSYLEVQVNTTNLYSINIQFDQAGTSNLYAPRDWKIQYSTDGTNFTDLPGGAYQITGYGQGAPTGVVSWSTTSAYQAAFTHSFNMMSALDNIANAYIRITMASGYGINGTLVTTSNGVAFDNIIITGSTTPPTDLPLHLLSFTAQPNTAGGALLSWKTAHEENVSHFSVERSYDARSYDSIGNVSAKNTLSGAPYSFTDPTPLTGKVYYRLRMVDYDGAYQYSNIEVLHGGSSAEVQIYPNPVRNELNINAGGKNVKVRVFGLDGRMLMEAQADRVNVNGLSAGMYLIEVYDAQNGSLLKTTRFTKE